MLQALSDAHTYLYEERERLLALQARGGQHASCGITAVSN